MIANKADGIDMTGCALNAKPGTGCICLKPASFVGPTSAIGG
jgi:hypothetical protein